MDDPKTTHEKAQEFFEELWKRGDPWELETSAFEQAKYDREIAILENRRYSRTLEIGCGIGTFTRRLDAISGNVVALDISPTAISRAREAGKGLKSVDFRVQNVIEFDIQKEGPWDLVVMNETIYYLGWLYSFFDVAWLVHVLFEGTVKSGQVLMANTCGGIQDYLLLPSIIRSYHDLFVNVGYKLTSDETFRGTKNNSDVEVLISLFTKL